MKTSNNNNKTWDAGNEPISQNLELQPKPRIGDDDGISNKAMNAMIVLFMLLTVGVSIATAVAGENVKYKILLRQAMLDMDRLDYDKAIPKLLEVRANSVENANVNHMLGMCYLYGEKSPEKAVYFLNRAVKDASEEYEFWILEETRAPIETTYHLAKAYEAIDDFDNAAVYYAMFLDHLDTNTNMAFSKTYALIKSRAQDCRMAAEHQKPSAEIQENVVFNK